MLTYRLPLLVYGSIAKPFDVNHRPPGVNADHTHQWSVYLKGIDNEDISYWLKKVQFKLHETYTNPLRTVEAPPFEVTETGWGEFEVQIKLFFVPEANEKPQIIWHGLKLHPYGPDAEAQRERRDTITSHNYEEVVFGEPVEAFYDILTGGGPPPAPARGKGSKGSKQAVMKRSSERSAEIPYAESADNPYSRKTEDAELDRLNEALKVVEGMLKEEKAKLAEQETTLEELRRDDAL